MNQRCLPVHVQVEVCPPGSSIAHMPASSLLLLLLTVLLASEVAGKPHGLRQLQQAPAPQPTGAFTGPTKLPVYISAGDVTDCSAVLWARCPSAATVKFVLWQGASQKSGKLFKTKTDSDSDYTVKVVIKSLHAGKEYRYQAQCGSLYSEVGSFRTAPKPHDKAAVSFAWVADIAGQGWGISDRPFKLTAEKPFNGDTLPGGFYFAETVSRLNPDFVVWAGDAIYADGPIPATQPVNVTKKGQVVEQSTWTNKYVKDFRAVTLDDFRKNWQYNLFDKYYAKLLRSTVQWAEWDDHETTNNWYPGEINSRPGVNADDISPFARQALFEYMPIKPGSTIYRAHRHGRHLEVINVDFRSYKSPNPNTTESTTLAPILGATQYKWLTDTLKKSTATWKIIVNDLPLSLSVTDGPHSWEAVAQNNSAILGRELELRNLLQFIKKEGVKNVAFITADVHMTAAYEYSPDSAAGGFKDFNPFYEFVIGACHAGAFDDPPLDPSFGPKELYKRTPVTEGYDQLNLPPPYTASFGWVSVDTKGQLTLQSRDIDGRVLFSKTLSPA